MSKTGVHQRPSLAQRLRGASWGPLPAAGLGAEVVQFAIVGLVGIAVNFGVSNAVLHITHWPAVRSSVAGTLVAIVANYVGYRYWVYRDSDAASRRREITLFLVFSGIGLLIENGTLWFTTYTLGLTSTLAYNGAKVAGTGIATLFRFFSYRTWVFKAIPELPEPAAVVEQAERILAGERVEYTAG